MSPVQRATWPEGTALTLARALAWWPLWTVFARLRLGQGLAATSALVAGWMVARLARGTGERVSLSGALLAAGVVAVAEAGFGIVARPLLAQMAGSSATALGVWVTCVLVFEGGRRWFSLGFASEPPSRGAERLRCRVSHAVFVAFALAQLLLPHGARDPGATWLHGAFGPALLPGIVGATLAWATARPLDPVRTAPSDPMAFLLPAFGISLALLSLFALAWRVAIRSSVGGTDPVGIALLASPAALAAAASLFARSRRAARGIRAIARNDEGASVLLSVDGGQSWVAAQTEDCRDKLERFPDDSVVTVVSFRGSTRPARHAFRGTSAMLEQVRAYEQPAELLARTLRWRAVGWAAWGVVGLCEVARSAW